MVESSIIDYKRNCLNTFRFIAAIEVLWIHALYHLELSDIPILGPIIEFFPGVPIFFTLSGFLIWHSIERSNNFCAYAKKRFWRIYPELWVAVFIEIVVLLILYKQPIDWFGLGLFTFGQATIFQFWTPDFLRGYGCGTPNGALWTIAILIQFYFAAFFIHKWMKNKSKMVWGGVILVSILVEILEPTIREALPTIVGKLFGVTLIPYLWMFMIAAFAAEFRSDVLPFLKKYWWLFVVVLIIKRYILQVDIGMNDSYSLLGTMLIFCGLIGFAYRYPTPNVRTDISYGIYIYHMTIINALLAMGFAGRSWTLWATVIGSCLLAWFSTITIGKWSAARKINN